jgi:hypothetical protein
VTAELPIVDLTPEGSRRWLYGLTADEWFQLAAVGEDSEVAPCCGDVSDFRETLNWLATSQGRGADWLPAVATWRAYLQDGEEHGFTSRDTFPLLHRVLDGIKAAYPEDVERIRKEVSDG